MHNYLRIALIVFIYTCIPACTQSNEPSQTSQAAQTEETTASPISEPSVATSQGEQHILFFGDSITAGYGLDIEQAFPALIQEKITAENLPFRVTNGGLSGETSSGGLNRIDWLLNQPVDIFILELGGNDGLRGVPLDLTASNLQSILDRVKEKNPEASLVVAGMQIPPNLGPDYTNQFKNLFPTLAENNSAALIPFILDGVAGDESLNLPDGIHPTAEGHSIVAETVWNTLLPIMEERIADAGDCSIPEDVNAAPEEDCEIDPELF